MNEVIFLDGDFAIIRSDAIFCTGYNCYKAQTQGGSDFVKINDQMSWFSTEEAAKKWLSGSQEYRAYLASRAAERPQQYGTHGADIGDHDSLRRVLDMWRR